MRSAMYPSEAQLLQFDKEAEQQRKRIYDGHLSVKGNNTNIWPGVKHYTEEEIKKITQTSYFVRNPEKLKNVRSEYPTYQRIFCMEPGYNMYMHRDDRQSIKDIGARFYEEEKDRDVPVLTSAFYGAACHVEELKKMCPGYPRQRKIPGFYRINGVGLAPFRKA